MSVKQSFGRVAGSGGIYLGFRAFFGMMDFGDGIVYSVLILMSGFGFWTWTVTIKIKPAIAIPK